MSRKPTLPGVDEEALASLARQFPPSSAPAENKSKAPGPAASGQAASGPATPAESKTTAPTASPPRSGIAIAALAFMLALVALVVAGPSAAPPELIERLRVAIGPNRAFDFLFERRAAIDAQFAADAAAIKGLEGRLSAATARVEAIEAVGGSSQAAAKRVDALEAAVNALVDRASAHEETVRAVTMRLNAAQLTAVALDSTLKAAIDRIGRGEEATKEIAGKVAAVDETNRRVLGELTASIDALKKVDRRPEKLYLAAIQLRSALQGSAPYGKELVAVTGLAGSSDELRAVLKVLASRAESGVPTVSDLRAAFAKNVSSRLAPYAPSSRESLSDRGFAWVRSWLPTGQNRTEASDNRNATAVALAERSLADGQLAAAVDQLLLLEDRAALLAAEWLREASARLAMDKAGVAVVNHAFDQLRAAP
ncbi:MAG: hypothetical protein HYR63_01740 [Proteobacteria bacterium]|nr:hypothetical protein [Pseudomonadota bacterium]